MLALTTVAMLAALQGGQQQRQQDFHWTGTLADGKTIAIRNINGEIRAMPASGNQIEVSATKHARRSDPASVQIKVEQNSAGVVICTIYPDQDGDSCDSRRSSHRGDNDNNDVAVDFVVRVPAANLLSAHSVNGGVSAERLANDAEISTVNGDVRVETDGFAEATTVNGSVDVTMGRADWRGMARYSSVNGDVSITLPSGASTDVNASTVNGGIDTDFPLTVSGKFGPRSIHGTIGDGGRSLSLKTVNGSISIHRRS